MRRASGEISLALSAGFDRVRELYAEIPESCRPDVTGERWQALEAEVDAQSGAGDRARAMRAIEAWREHAERVLLTALLHAPLEDRKAA